MYRIENDLQNLKNKLASGGSVVAIGLSLTLATAGIVYSAAAQSPSNPPRPLPAAQAAPAAQTQAVAARPLTDEQIALMTRTLGEAASHGFRAGEFGPTELDTMLKARDPAARARGEALLKHAIAAYAAAQHGQRLPADDFLGDWGVRPIPYDAQADLDFALGQGRLEQWLASLPPPFERYRQLRTALGQYRAIAARGGWPAIGEGPALKPGMIDDRVVQLRLRLAAENPPGSIETTSPVYDDTLAAIVQAAQARYGLKSDGVVGGATLRAFNMPVEGRIAQIAANMERWRWMPRAWPTVRIEVNIPDQQLTLYAQNKPVDAMKVVVGQPGKKTPMLISAVRSIIVNPPWNVPKSIARSELVPKGQGYLRANGFTWVSDGAGGSRLQQRPGPGNSLGRIKFDFDNPYGVYLHDTPAKAAFDREERSLSHGCVRLERPQELAAILLGQGWDQAKLQAIVDTMETERIDLPQKIPVMLLYWTVFISPDGQVNFRNDTYRWDERLSGMLELGKITA